jgi:hypothetical protein
MGSSLKVEFALRGTVEAPKEVHYPRP